MLFNFCFLSIGFVGKNRNEIQENWCAELRFIVFVDTHIQDIIYWPYQMRLPMTRYTFPARLNIKLSQVVKQRKCNTFTFRPTNVFGV